MPDLCLGRPAPRDGPGDRADLRIGADGELQQGLPRGQHPRGHSDPDWNDGFYGDKPPIRGVKAMAALSAGWGFSEPFYRQEVFRAFGASTVEEFIDYFWDAFFIKCDADDLLAQMWTWWHNDLGDHPEFGGDFEAALGAIRARTIILEAETDSYFPPVDSEYEARHILGADPAPSRRSGDTWLRSTRRTRSSSTAPSGTARGPRPGSSARGLRTWGGLPTCSPAPCCARRGLRRVSATGRCRLRFVPGRGTARQALSTADGDGGSGSTQPRSTGSARPRPAILEPSRRPWRCAEALPVCEIGDDGPREQGRLAFNSTGRRPRVRRTPARQRCRRGPRRSSPGSSAGPTQRTRTWPWVGGCWRPPGCAAVRHWLSAGATSTWTPAGSSPLQRRRGEGQGRR